MYRFTTLFILNPIIIFFTYLIIGYFIFSFYGCSRECVLNMPFEIFGLSYGIIFIFGAFLPFSIFFLIPVLVPILLLPIAIRNHSLRFTISKSIKIAILTISALIPLPGIISVINRANQHPYYWDVVQKGSDMSYLSFISGDIIWYACIYLVFLLAVYFLIKLFERKA